MPASLSLHIGLNSFDADHYGEPGTLAGCENDAKAMTKLAKSRGFTPLTKAPLLTKKATAANVVEGIKAAAATLQAGDTFFITYAGHGSQTPDTNGDEDDSMDETWCLYDRMLVDDELAALWASFKAGVRIIMLSDSCHSGSVSRAGGRAAQAMVRPLKGKRYRFFPTNKALRVYRAHSDAYDAIQRGTRAGRNLKIKASVLLISGCQDNQLSGDGDVNGLFTETLLDAWAGGTFTGGYRRFRDKIASWMPRDQQPHYSLIGAANPAFEREQPFTATPAAQ
jgi:metacaspase-1